MIQTFIALVIVIALILLSAFIFTKFRNAKIFDNFTSNKLINCSQETFFLDHKRKIVIVKYKKKKYILLISQNSESIIDIVDSLEE